MINQKKSWSIVVNNLCYQACVDGRIKINSNPNLFRNFIYVKDIVNEIIANLLKNENIFQVKNIGSGKNHTFLSVAEIIKDEYKKLTDKNIKIILKK